MKQNIVYIFSLLALSTFASAKTTYICTALENDRPLEVKLIMTYSDDRTISLMWSHKTTPFYVFEHAPNESIVNLTQEYLHGKYSRFINDMRHYTEVGIDVYINLANNVGWFIVKRGANEDQFDFENQNYVLTDCQETEEYDASSETTHEEF